MEGGIVVRMVRRRLSGQRLEVPQRGMIIPRLMERLTLPVVDLKGRGTR